MFVEVTEVAEVAEVLRLGTRVKSKSKFLKINQLVGLHWDRQKTCFLKNRDEQSRGINYFGIKATEVFIRFLYNRLALVIHCDSHLSSITLPCQLLSLIKIALVYQMLH